jgi:putative glutathione S-transferase
MGPYPHIEEGFDEDFDKLKVGKMKLPAVLEYQAKL